MIFVLDLLIIIFYHFSITCKTMIIYFGKEKNLYLLIIINHLHILTYFFSVKIYIINNFVFIFKNYSWLTFHFLNFTIIISEFFNLLFYSYLKIYNSLILIFINFLNIIWGAEYLEELIFTYIYYSWCQCYIESDRTLV